jgi:filamentous hemagglutinin family protein
MDGATGGRTGWARKATSLLLLAGMLIAPPGVPVALAAPSGERVVRGQVDFQHRGDLTLITASDGSIIHYDSFDILEGETVRFIQPDALARVLNRDLGPDPTRIDGSLLANGQVYILNPAGIFFGGRAVVDTARLVAAAGHLSNADFQAGIDRFTGLTGPVENRGGIRADAVSLLGRTVANHGRIVAQGGMIALAAGDEVLLTNLGGHVLVRVEGPEEDPGTWGIESTGSLDAGEVVLSAGDVYSLAANHTGIAHGGRIQVAGGGLVQVSGELDGSDASPGATGGRVEVRGEKVALLGAHIDASGDAGGGEVLIGGDFQGRGPGPNASRTFVDADTEIRADALGEGDGGTVIVWADEATGFHGAIRARGGERGGDGGFAEVSGKDAMVFRGDADLGAAAGSAGTLLLDPRDIAIEGGSGGTDDAQLDPDIPNVSDPAGAILSGDVPGASFTISEDKIETTDANIVLEATNSITVSGDFGDDDVQIMDGHDLTMRTINDATGEIDGIDLTGSSAGTGLEFETTGDGTITVESGSGGGAAGDAPVVLSALTTAGGSITVNSEGDMTVAEIDAADGDVALTSAEGSILDDGDAGTWIVGGDLTLAAEAQDASIGESGAAIDVALIGSLTASASTGNGGIFVTEIGPMEVGDVNAHTGTVELEATLGSILDDGDAGTRIVGGDLTLTAETTGASIGGSESPIGVELDGSLTASAPDGGGGIFVTETGPMLVASVAAGTGALRLEATGGSIEESADDDNDNILTTGAVTLVAETGIGAVSTLELGEVTDLTLDTDGNFDVSTSGTLTDLAVTVNPAGASGLEPYKLVDNDGGTTHLTFDVGVSAGALEVTEVSAGTDPPADLNFALTSDSGNINVGTVNAGSGRVALEATEGSIVEIVGSGTTDNILTTGAVTLVAETGIGAVSTLDLEGVTDLSLDTDGNFDVSTSGTLTDLAVTVDPAGASGLEPYELVDNDGGTTHLTFDVGVSAGALEVTEVSAGTDPPADLNFALTADSGDMNLGAVNAGAGTVALEATTGSIEEIGGTADNILTTGAVTLVAETGIGAVSTLDLEGVTDLSLDTDGNFDVSTSGTLTDLAVTVAPAGASGLEPYELVDNDGDTNNLTFDVDVSASGLAVNDVSVDTGDLDLALTADSGDMNVGTVNARAGRVTLEASAGAIDSAANDDTEDVRGATVNLIAAAGGIGTTSALEVRATAALNADTAAGDEGNIRIEGIGDLPVGLVDAGAGDVELTSMTGSILDDAADGLVDIAGGALVLAARESVGRPFEDLETEVDSLSATAGGGGLFVVEWDGLTVDSVETRGGHVAIASVEGPIDVGSINASGASGRSGGDAGHITLETLFEGDISITGDLTATGGEGTQRDGGSGGSVFVQAGGGSLTVSDSAVIDTSGGMGERDGGRAGDIAFQAWGSTGDVELSGELIAQGGWGTNGDGGSGGDVGIGPPVGTDTPSPRIVTLAGVEFTTSAGGSSAGLGGAEGRVTVNAEEDALGGGTTPDASATGDLEIWAAEIGGGEVLEIAGAGGAESTLKLVATGAVNVDLTPNNFGAIDLIQRDATAEADIEITGIDEIHIDGADGGTGGRHTSTIESLLTTGSGLDFRYQLEAELQPADLVILESSTAVGGDGTFVNLAGDVLLGGGVVAERDLTVQVLSANRIALGADASSKAVSTGGSQTYLGRMELLEDAELVSGREVFFESTVDTDPGVPETEPALAVIAGGKTTFGGSVGAQRALGGLSVETPGDIEFGPAEPGDTGFPGTLRVVTGEGGILLNTGTTRDFTGSPPHPATLYNREGSLSFETDGGFETGHYEKLSTVGRLEIQADSARVGDLSAFAIDVDADGIVLLARPEGGEAEVADYVASLIRFSTHPEIEGTAAGQAIVTLATQDGVVLMPGSQREFEVRLFQPDGSGVSPGDLLRGETVLDLTPTGPLAVGDPSSAIPRPPVEVAALIEPRFGRERPPRVTSRPGAADVLAFIECAQPEGAGAAVGCPAPGEAAPALEGGAIDPVFATERAHQTAALYRRLTDPEPRAQKRRDALGRAAGDYRQLGATAGVGGGGFYHFLERSPHHAQALEFLDQLALLLAQLRLMGLAEDDSQQVERVVAEQILAATPGEGLSAEALLEAAHTGHGGVLH